MFTLIPRLQSTSCQFKLIKQLLFLQNLLNLVALGEWRMAGWDSGVYNSNHMMQC